MVSLQAAAAAEAVDSGQGRAGCNGSEPRTVTFSVSPFPPAFMVQTKKHVQSSTILDFFPGKSFTPAKQKTAARSATSVKRKAPQQARPTPVLQQGSTDDVIVISDEEDERPSALKRVKMEENVVEDDSDVEIVESNAPDTSKPLSKQSSAHMLAERVFTR